MIEAPTHSPTRSPTRSPTSSKWESWTNFDTATALADSLNASFSGVTFTGTATAAEKRYVAWDSGFVPFTRFRFEAKYVDAAYMLMYVETNVDIYCFDVALQTGTVSDINSVAQGATYIGGSVTVEDMGGGYYRYTCTLNSGDPGTGVSWFNPHMTDNATGAVTHTDAGTKTFLFRNVQYQA